MLIQICVRTCEKVEIVGENVEAGLAAGGGTRSTQTNAYLTPLGAYVLYQPQQLRVLLCHYMTTSLGGLRCCHFLRQLCRDCFQSTLAVSLRQSWLASIIGSLLPRHSATQAQEWKRHTQFCSPATRYRACSVRRGKWQTPACLLLVHASHA